MKSSIHPLVLYENHAIPSCIQFLIANLSLLAGLGYKKFLFEFDQVQKPEDMKKQLYTLCRINDGNLQRAYFKYLLNLWEKLESQGLEYGFVDPESGEESALRNMELGRANASGDQNRIKKLMTMMQLNTDNRDEYITKRVIAESEYYNGGVVYITGFMHTRILALLEEYRSSYFRFLVFNSKRIERDVCTQLVDLDHEKWVSLGNPVKRLAHFQSPVVQYWDLDTSPSFELVAASGQFTQCTKIDPKPYIGKGFEEVTKKLWDFFMDELSILTARVVTSVAEGRRLSTELTKQLPSLLLSEEITGDQMVISAHGLNLPENGKRLSAVLKAKH